jgi:hypothetical protein
MVSGKLGFLACMLLGFGELAASTKRQRFFVMQHYVGAKQKAATHRSVTADCEMLLFVRLRCFTDC